MVLRRCFGHVRSGAHTRAPERPSSFLRKTLSRSLPAAMPRVLSGRSSRSIARIPAAALPISFLAPDPAAAAAPNLSFLSFEQMAGSQVAGVSLFVALVIFSASTALLHLAGRRRWQQREAQLVEDLTSARAALDRANVFLSAEPQIIVAWGTASGEPDIEGDLSLVMDVPVPRRVLGFGSWLAADVAQDFEQAVDRLRNRGESFRQSFVSLAGRHLEAEGRAVSGRAVMRIRDVSGDRLELMRLRDRHAKTLMEIDALRAMLDAIPDPVWMRNLDGELTWVNSAYARAVEAADGRAAVIEGAELLDRQARDASQKKRAANETWQARVSAVVAGQRHSFAVIDVPAPGGSVGMANDMSELDAIRRDLGEQMESHSRTLDQLTTAVAIFDRSKRLVFHNSAYRQLWGLDAAFLDQAPSDSEVLDQLRSERKLPEQADFRSWKATLMQAYQSNETDTRLWYLPDRRTLRVVTNPNPQGGITYLFDDVTERYLIESQYNALISVQDETLDTLKEGVAVFGSDGCLKLFNSAFATLWSLDNNRLAGNPHIDEVAHMCRDRDPGGATWARLRTIVVGLHDQRDAHEWRAQCSENWILDCATAPLSDGATLVTCTDVTASVMGERALQERNQALLETQKLRNDFVHHVSYELRSPLTNIIGYAELLGDETVGALNNRQSEYAGYVLKSSAALLAIINDILDLATIDNDEMELSYSDVDVRKTIDAAAEGLQDRFTETNIRLQRVIGDDVGSFVGDAKRVRQVLFNLLSNAVGFSEAGQTVTLAALRRDGNIVFKVSDQGRGIPADVLAQVFDRFHTSTAGSRHRGVGLGLSIVRSFVELHGGEVHIDSAPGEGTTVTCTFPAVRRQIGGDGQEESAITRDSAAGAA